MRLPQALESSLCSEAELCLLVLGFVPSWQEYLRWTLAYPDFSSGRARPSVLNVFFVGEPKRDSLSLSPLEALLTHDTFTVSIVFSFPEFIQCYRK